MRRRALVMPLLLCTLLADVRAQAAADGVEGLGWLEGRWEGVSDGISMEEHWTSVRGGALLGMHRDVEGDRMVSFEFLRIQAGPEGVVYFASPGSRPPVGFTLVETGERRAVFQNLEHDFPQRILYWIDAAGAMHARIEGPRAGQTVSREWVWTRTRTGS